MPDTPRYVTLRTGLYVQVLDLGPVQNCEPAKTMATCTDSTSAATVALALNMAHEHDVDAMEAQIRRLDAAICHLLDHAEAGYSNNVEMLKQSEHWGVVSCAVDRHEAGQ